MADGHGSLWGATSWDCLNERQKSQKALRPFSQHAVPCRNASKLEQWHPPNRKPAKNVQSISTPQTRIPLTPKTPNQENPQAQFQESQDTLIHPRTPNQDSSKPQIRLARPRSAVAAARKVPRPTFGHNMGCEEIIF